jgi:hypothetical protein
LCIDGFSLVLSEEEGKQINFRRTRMLIKVSNDDSDGKYSLIEMTHPPSMGPALHIHRMHLKPIMYLMGSIQYNAIKGHIRSKQEILYSFQKVVHILIIRYQKVERHFRTLDKWPISFTLAILGIRTENFHVTAKNSLIA